MADIESNKVGGSLTYTGCWRRDESSNGARLVSTESRSRRRDERIGGRKGSLLAKHTDHRPRDMRQEIPPTVGDRSHVDGELRIILSPHFYVSIWPCTALYM